MERPDLHEDSSILADKLHHTLHSKILTLPDHVQIFPAHKNKEYFINEDKNNVRYITITDIKENKLFKI